MILWGSILRAFLSTGQRELLPQSGIDRKTPHPILRIPPVIAHQLASARKKFLRGVPPHVARRKHCEDECVTLRTHGRMAQAGSLANAQQLAGAFLKPRPGWLDDDHRLVIRLFFQRFGTATFINLHKLH